MARTKSEAKKLGLKRFFNGIPCPAGHVAERLTSNSACIECHNKRKKAWLENFYKSEVGAEKSRQAYRKWRATNPGTEQAKTVRRRKGVKQRTPSWADIDKIREFYENCPEGMTVDHVIPLHGKIVSGLHVESNLQYLSKEANSAKGNKYEV